MAVPAQLVQSRLKAPHDVLKPPFRAEFENDMEHRAASLTISAIIINNIPGN